MIRQVTAVVVGLAGVLVPASAEAQRWTRPVRRFLDRYYAIEVGVTGAVNRNTVTSAGPVEAKYRAAGGVFLSFPVGEHFRFRPEATVAGKLVGEVAPVLPELCPPTVLCQAIQTETVHSFTWLELPLLLEARFGRALGGWGTPKVFAGPFVAVRLACSVTTPAFTPVPQPAAGGPKVVTSCADADPRYHNGDAGFVVGTGLSIGSVGLGFRWTRSLVPVAPAGSVVGRLAGAKNSTLSITLDLSTRIRG